MFAPVADSDPPYMSNAVVRSISSSPDRASALPVRNLGYDGVARRYDMNETLSVYILGASWLLRENIYTHRNPSEELPPASVKIIEYRRHVAVCNNDYLQQ